MCQAYPKILRLADADFGDGLIGCFEKPQYPLKCIMASWRMAMRRGYRGEDIFKQCFNKRLAAISYNTIFKTDLSRYSPDRRPPGWNGLAASQKGSISKFAWQIRAGDKLYVRDSGRPNLLVGFGYVTGKEGKLAYFYDERSPIKTENGEVWHHLMRVDWEHAFREIPYKDHSANTTVLEIDEDELSTFRQQAKRVEHQEHGLSHAEIDLAVDLETAYPRATPATIRLILPKHVTLSKMFRTWLMEQHSIRGERELRQIDMQFKIGHEPAMAEFKIAYNGNTKAAVREALGQILEYNHYPGRDLTQAWFLVLDQRPCDDDRTFVESLRAKWGCPIYLAWKRAAGFSFYPQSPLG
jgi:hypothetical protein